MKWDELFSRFNRSMKSIYLLLLFILVSFQMVAFASLDLHAHLDMKPGMGPLLQGSFDSPPLATNWNSRLKTKASETSLLEGFYGKNLIVMSFYAHPFFSNSGQALDAEYQHLIAFISKHANRYGIAKNPLQAKNLLDQGKNVIVLSIEGAADVLENEADFKKWIDDRGVAIVTPFHLTEDHFGGVALLQNSLAWINSPFRFLLSVFHSHGKCLFSFCKSEKGIKPDGRELIQKLMSRKVWIDLAHANDLEAQELLPMFEKLNLPLLVSHTQLRAVYPAERGISELEIQYLKKQGGMIGLLPSEDLIIHAIESSTQLRCKSGLFLYKQIFQNIRSELGKMHVALASDINAPIQGLSPICEATDGHNLIDLEKRGYYTYSQWNDLNQFVSEEVSWSEAIIVHFLYEWNRIKE